MDVALALPRFAKTGIYLRVPRDLQRAARGRAAAEATTLQAVLIQALRDYASGAWTPRPQGKRVTRWSLRAFPWNPR